MAMILDFRSRPETRSEAQNERSEPVQAEPIGAQIIIFPGVRRERHAEAPKPQRRKSRPKRDRLELLD
jgi:hypothetical protein